MIPFLMPYYGDKEQIDLANDLSPYFPRGNFCVVSSGRYAIALAVQNIREASKKTQFLISIPSMICGSVYEAVKEYGDVCLMDCKEDYFCIPDADTEMADVAIYASLGGKRMELPPKYHKYQIRIDDAAQCYDGICGIRDADFGVFSFGKGKQMYADGGGILYGNLQGNFCWGVSTAQLLLMKQQLSIINKINWKRQHNARIMITELKYLDWLKLPDPTNHVFSKFTVFLNIPVPDYSKERHPKLMEFYRHMGEQGVECEFSYIPLHVRFPKAFPQKIYKEFYCNRLWPVSLTLPCRPNLTEQELGQVINAVRSFKI